MSTLYNFLVKGTQLSIGIESEDLTPELAAEVLALEGVFKANSDLSIEQENIHLESSNDLPTSNKE